MKKNVNIDPRFLKYDKEDVEKILDGAIQLEENDNPMSLMTAE